MIVITKIDLLHLFVTLKEGARKNQTDPVWVRAFEFYNLSKPARPPQMPLSLHCAPCYIKVYTYIAEKLKGIDNVGIIQ